MASPICGTDRKLQVNKCHLLDLPPELRLKIYRILRQDVIQDEKTFVLRSTEKYSMVVPHIRNSSSKTTTALLRSCKTIRHEAAVELYKDTSLKLLIAPDTCRWCVSCEGGKQIITKQLLRLLRYLFSRIKRVVISLQYRNSRCVDSSILRLEAIAEALSDDSIVDSIEVLIDFLPSWPSRPAEGEVILKTRLKDILRELKEARSQSFGRDLLWSATEEHLKDICCTPRGRYVVEQILDSRIRKRPGKAKKNKARSTYVEYLVKPQAYYKAIWEYSGNILPEANELATEFHRQYPHKSIPSDFDLSYKPMRLLVNAWALDRLQNTEHSMATGDMEDDLSFAFTMAALSRKVSKF